MLTFEIVACKVHNELGQTEQNVEAGSSHSLFMQLCLGQIQSIFGTQDRPMHAKWYDLGHPIWSHVTN